mgnify:CR=1 FL=1
MRIYSYCGYGKKGSNRVGDASATLWASDLSHSSTRRVEVPKNFEGAAVFMDIERLKYIHTGRWKKWGKVSISTNFKRKKGTSREKQV